MSWSIIRFIQVDYLQTKLRSYSSNLTIVWLVQIFCQSVPSLYKIKILVHKSSIKFNVSVLFLVDEGKTEPLRPPLDSDALLSRHLLKLNTLKTPTS